MVAFMGSLALAWQAVLLLNQRAARRDALLLLQYELEAQEELVRMLDFFLTHNVMARSVLMDMMMQGQQACSNRTSPSSLMWEHGWLHFITACVHVRILLASEAASDERRRSWSLMTHIRCHHAAALARAAAIAGPAAAAALAQAPAPASMQASL